MPSWLSWVAFVAVCLAAGGAGSFATAASVKTWYPTLRLPPGTPPSWVFGPVWTTLYLLMGTAAWLVWRQRLADDITVALTLFFIQLVLNALWSFLFFGARQPGFALAELLVLLALVGATALSFAPISRPAFWLMLPYFAWVSYAGYLNAGIWSLNR